MSRYDIATGAAAEFEKGKFQTFIAEREVSLNFDDRRIKSVKLRINDQVSYDGEVATFTKPSGEPVTGKASGLKAAILKAHWLSLAPTGKKTVKKAEKKVEEKKAEKKEEKVTKDYDTKRGGNFNTFIGTQDNVTVGKTSQIIREEDRIVKRTAEKKPVVQGKPTGKLPVDGDQVVVDRSKRTVVNSSTVSNAPQARRASTITRADEMGAERTIPTSYKKEVPADPKKRNSYTVDEHTPALPEETTLKDVQKAKGVSRTDESQEAKVIGRTSRTKPEVQEIDGVTLRKTDSPEDMTIKTTVGAGSTPVGDSSDGVVVAQTTQIPKAVVPNSKAAEAKAEAEKRKKAAAQTQAQVEAGKKPKATVPPAAGQDYMSLLPDTWGDMHWVQKEKFVKSLTDKEFLKFILTVETIKAVLNACEDRLKELENA